MTDQNDKGTPAPTLQRGSIPEAQANEIRRLAHDLSNALEIIVQSNYLLGLSQLDESSRQWVTLLDKGTRQAATINQQLREYIRANS